MAAQLAPPVISADPNCLPSPSHLSEPSTSKGLPDDEQPAKEADADVEQEPESDTDADIDHGEYERRKDGLLRKIVLCEQHLQRMKVTLKYNRKILLEKRRNDIRAGTDPEMIERKAAIDAEFKPKYDYQQALYDLGRVASTRKAEGEAEFNARGLSDREIVVEYEILEETREERRAIHERIEREDRLRSDVRALIGRHLSDTWLDAFIISYIEEQDRRQAAGTADRLLKRYRREAEEDLEKSPTTLPYYNAGRDQHGGHRELPRWVEARFRKTDREKKRRKRIAEKHKSVRMRQVADVALQDEVERDEDEDGVLIDEDEDTVVDDGSDDRSDRRRRPRVERESDLDDDDDPERCIVELTRNFGRLTEVVADDPSIRRSERERRKRTRLLKDISDYARECNGRKMRRALTTILRSREKYRARSGAINQGWISAEHRVMDEDLNRIREDETLFKAAWKRYQSGRPLWMKRHDGEGYEMEREEEGDDDDGEEEDKKEKDAMVEESSSDEDDDDSECTDDLEELIERERRRKRRMEGTSRRERDEEDDDIVWIDKNGVQQKMGGGGGGDEGTREARGNEDIFANMRNMDCPIFFDPGFDLEARRCGGCIVSRSDHKIIQDLYKIGLFGRRPRRAASKKQSQRKNEIARQPTPDRLAAMDDIERAVVEEVTDDDLKELGPERLNGIMEEIREEWRGDEDGDVDEGDSGEDRENAGIDAPSVSGVYTPSSCEENGGRQNDRKVASKTIRDDSSRGDHVMMEEEASSSRKKTVITTTTNKTTSPGRPRAKNQKRKGSERRTNEPDKVAPPPTKRPLATPHDLGTLKQSASNGHATRASTRSRNSSISDPS